MKAKILAAAVLFSLVVAVSFRAVPVRQVRADEPIYNEIYCGLLWDQLSLTFGQLAPGYISPEDFEEFYIFWEEQMAAANCPR